MQNSQKILFPDGGLLPLISPCDHYAGSEKLITKSLELQKTHHGVFDITCDLEDGAKVGDESSLRATFADLILSSLNTHKKVGLRIHEYSSPFFVEDLQSISKELATTLSHITVPKIESAVQAQLIVKTIHGHWKNLGITSYIPIHLLIELPSAVRDVWQIASIPGVRCLDFGLMDFVSSHSGAISDYAMHSPGQFEHAIVCRAKTELTAACGVFIHLKLNQFFLHLPHQPMR